MVHWPFGFQFPPCPIGSTVVHQVPPIFQSFRGVEEGVRGRADKQKYHCPRNHNPLWRSLKHCFFSGASHGCSSCPGESDHSLPLKDPCYLHYYRPTHRFQPWCSSVLPRCWKASPPPNLLRQALGATRVPSSSFLHYLRSPPILSVLPLKHLPHLFFSPSPSSSLSCCHLLPGPLQ